MAPAIGTRSVRFWPWLAVLSILAAGLAVVDALTTANPQGDPLFFHVTGNLIAHGHGYIRPETFQAGRREVATALHPPLYPLLVASTSVLGVTDFTAQRAVLGALLAAAIVIGSALLGRRLGGPRVGLIAAALTAVMPSFVAAVSSGESEPLFGAIMLGCLILAYRATEQPTLTASILLGGSIGLATLTRGEGAILLAIPLIVAWRCRGTRGSWWRLATALATAAIVVAPWLVRNGATLGRPLLSTNLGTLLAGANCRAVYYGTDAGTWRHCFHPVQPGPTSADEARWSRELIRVGLSYARYHVDRVPAVVLARVGTVWSIGSLPSWDRPYLTSDELHWAAIAFYFPILILGAIGAIILRRRGPPIALMLVPLFLTTVIAAIGWGSTRFRYTGELALVVLAAVTLERLLRRWRPSQRMEAAC